MIPTANQLQHPSYHWGHPEVHRSLVPKRAQTTLGSLFPYYFRVARREASPVGVLPIVSGPSHQFERHNCRTAPESGHQNVFRRTDHPLQSSPWVQFVKLHRRCTFLVRALSVCSRSPEATNDEATNKSNQSFQLQYTYMIVVPRTPRCFVFLFIAYRKIM